MLHNQPTWYQGIQYPSIAEAKYAEHLDREKKVGRVKWWKRQWPFKVEGDKLYTIIADFYVMAEREEIHEVKRGYYSPDFIYKSGLWLEQYPSIPYYVLEYTGTGFTKTPLAEFMKQFELALPTPMKQWQWWEVLLSKWFYTLASKLVDNLKISK